MPQLHLFGTPCIDRGDRIDSFLPDKRYQFLVYLAAAADWIGRDELATLFWPEKPTAKARHSLRQLLRRVRGLAFAEGLEAERDRIRWLIDSDLRAFENALAEERHPELFGLYRGRFLEGMAARADGEFATWLGYERDHLHARWRGAMLRWIGELAGAGDTDRAGPVVTTLLEHDPFDEDALQALLRLAGATEGRRPALERYRDFARTLERELGLEPTAETRRLARVLERGNPVVPAAGGAGAPAGRRSEPPSPPTPLSSFVGRTRETAALLERLERPDCRLVTVVGMGGMGKSRLVVQAREVLAARYPAGLVFVALDTLSGPELVPDAIARALGVPLVSREGIGAHLARAIGAKRLLLVLDNFEHLLAAAVMVADLIRACPALDVLVTSREVLDLEEEWLLPLGGLGYPAAGASADEALGSDAIRLFAERMRRVNFEFELDPDTLPHALRIARAVDGSPLGLELAATSARRMPVAEIAARIEDELDLLESNHRNRFERHASLRVTFEHSWRLLSDVERDVLRDLSVFRGGFVAGAAEAVADAPPAVLGALIDKSLLRLGDDGRYDRHPLLYRFGREKLATEADRLHRLRARHARYYRHLLQRRGGAGKVAPELPEEEWENVRTVFDWMAEEAPPLQLVDWLDLLDRWFDAAMRFLEALDYLSYAERCLDERGGKSGAGLGVARGCVGLHRGWYLFRLGRLAEACEISERALERLRALPSTPPRLLVRGVNTLGAAAAQMGRKERAQELFREALALARRTNDEQVANGLNNLALAEADRGDYPAAERCLREAAAIHERHGRVRAVVRARSNLADIYALMDRPRDARTTASDALELARRIEFEQAIPYLLLTLGELEVNLGHPDRAAPLLHETLELGERHAAIDLQVSALVALSDVAAASNDGSAAHAFARRALRLAWGAGKLPNALSALLRIVEYARPQEPRRVAPLLAVIAEHPATVEVERARARERLEDLLSDAGRAAPGTITLEAAVAALLGAS